ncbi:MAG: peptide/nickel transport system permease protein [Nocardioidaceae bacterium]|jgi:peptide/nickel transport system permease protein|nr:peptide/nickel transport system permease protein [Nocardioidaceae bacterium]
MTGFIVRRLLGSAVVVVLTSIFVFVLFFKGLGDSPARNYCEKLGPGKCTEQKLDSIKHQMGFDKSVAYNYTQWAKGIFLGRHDVYDDGKLYDCPAPCLGISVTTSAPVWDDLKQKYPATVIVAIGGASIYLTFGVLMGAMAARWRGTTLDRGLVAGSLVLSAIPNYLIILLAWIFFSLRWKIFPDVGYYPITQNPLKTISWMMLPWLVLGFTSLTDYARFTRGQMVETLEEDYIRTARAKGVRSTSVLFRHALRAAIVPVITIFGIDFASLLSGTIFIEQIFGIDGIGHWGLQALQTPLDINVISATVLVGSILVVVANLVVDIVYGLLDPRVVVA